MTVAQCRAVMTPREFEGWVEYILWEETRDTKQDYYLANIAAEVRRGWVSEKAKPKMTDFMLKFNKPTAVEQKQSPKQSKSIWLAALGVNTSKKKKKGK